MDILRRCIFSPYLPGKGPKFRLTMWATNRYDKRGQQYIGYSLKMTDNVSKRFCSDLFSGEDFAGSPIDADDSDATVAGLMNFLTLRPGDTDSEYFEKYTPEQLDYCTKHAETLSGEIEARFGERE